MLTAALFAMTLTACPRIYDQYGDATIEFQQGSVQISDEGRNEIASLLTPLVNDPLAEIQIDVNFPFGVLDDSDPKYQFASARFDHVKDTVVQLGIDPSLIGGSIQAIGYDVDSDYVFHEVQYDLAELDRVKVKFWVKSSCHPLLELAQRMNPYR